MPKASRIPIGFDIRRIRGSQDSDSLAKIFAIEGRSTREHTVRLLSHATGVLRCAIRTSYMRARQVSELHMRHAAQTNTANSFQGNLPRAKPRSTRLGRHQLQRGALRWRLAPADQDALQARRICRRWVVLRSQERRATIPGRCTTTAHHPWTHRQEALTNGQRAATASAILRQCFTDTHEFHRNGRPALERGRRFRTPRTQRRGETPVHAHSADGRGEDTAAHAIQSCAQLSSEHTFLHLTERTRVRHCGSTGHTYNRRMNHSNTRTPAWQKDRTNQLLTGATNPPDNYNATKEGGERNGGRAYSGGDTGKHVRIAHRSETIAGY